MFLTARASARHGIRNMKILPIQFGSEVCIAPDIVVVLAFAAAKR
jgi:hypothetical protein